MPTLQDVIARGQQRWQQFLQQMQGWTPPSQDEMEMKFDNAGDLARAYLNHLIDATGAARLLSPFYLDTLRRNAIRPFLQQAVLAGAEYGISQPGNFGDFLKNWLAMSPSGFGNIGDYRQRAQQLLNRIQAGRAATAGTDYELANAWFNNPEMLTAALALGTQGLFRNYYQRQIQDALEAAQAQGPGTDWLEYLFARVPGLGFRYQGP